MIIGGYVCDGCGLRDKAIDDGKRFLVPEGWASVGVSVVNSKKEQGIKEYHFCPGCAGKMDIVVPMRPMVEDKTDELVEKIYRLMSEGK